MLKYRVKRHAVTQPLDASYRLIPLTQNQNAIVDTADVEWLSQWNWCAQWNPNTNSFYARRKNLVGRKWEHIAMHAVILQCSDEEEGDHKNHDTLDNRRSNLRKASHGENTRNARVSKRNKTGFKGVFCRDGKYRVMIRHNSKLFHLGTFISKEEAARRYDEAAKAMHGEFACLNFPASPERSAKVNSSKDCL